MPWFSNQKGRSAPVPSKPGKPPQEYFPELSGWLAVAESHELLILAIEIGWRQESILQAWERRKDTIERIHRDFARKSHAEDQARQAERLAKVRAELGCRSLQSPLPAHTLQDIRRGLSLDWTILAYFAASAVARNLGGSRIDGFADSYRRSRLDEAWDDLSHRLSPERLPFLDALYGRSEQDVQRLLMEMASGQKGWFTRYDGAGFKERGISDIRSLWHHIPETLEVKRTRAMLERRDHEILPRPVIDLKRLEQEWEDSRHYIERAVATGELPPSEFPYTPYLDVLKNRITSEWTWISEPELFDGCLGLIDKLKEDIGNALLGYEILKVAYMLGQDSWRAEQVAAAEDAYRKASSP